MVIAIVVAIVVALFMAMVSTRPETFQVQRRGTMKAPAERVFGKLNDFREWISWSPWEGIDPAMQRTYSGPAAGVGAGYHWIGNKKVGEGKMEITGSEPSKRLTIKLDFIKPFEAHNITVFELTSAGDETTVIWTMNGKNTFMGKVMCLFVNMDNLIGKDFERGLVNLRAAVEQ